MELTREQLEIIADDESQLEYHVAGSITRGMIAKQLLLEMDKPKVWDNAPEWCTQAQVIWECNGKPSEYKRMYSKAYIRTLPKSPERVR